MVMAVGLCDGFRKMVGLVSGEVGRGEQGKGFGDVNVVFWMDGIEVG